MLDVISLCLTPLIWALNLFYEMLQRSQLLGFYIAIFFIFTVARLFLRPLIGTAQKLQKAGDD